MFNRAYIYYPHAYKLVLTFLARALFSYITPLINPTFTLILQTMLTITLIFP